MYAHVLCMCVQCVMHRTIFSPSPIHLEHNDAAEMVKKVAPQLHAMALPIMVLPVPALEIKTSALKC